MCRCRGLPGSKCLSSAPPANKAAGVAPTAWLFGEDQGRYLVTTADAPALCAAANALGIAALPIGETGGQAVSILGGDEVSLDTLRAAHEGFFPTLMGADAALA